MTSPSTDRRLGLTGDKAYKAPVTAATTANITLSGEQTIDGVAVHAVNVAGYPDRVLVKNQTNQVENGIWDVSTAAWTRSLDCNTTQDLVNRTQVIVSSGGTDTDQIYAMMGTNPIIPGTSPISFKKLLPQSPFRFSVTEYGATGDGVTDDTVAIKAACTAASVSGGILYFPPGTYLWSSSTAATVGDGVTIQGAGKNASIIKTTIVSASIFNCTGLGSGVQDMGFSSSVTNTSGYFITLASQNQYVNNLHITGDFLGINVTGVAPKIENTTFSSGASGATRIKLDCGDASPVLHNILINAQTAPLAQYGIDCTNVTALMMSDVVVLTCVIGLNITPTVGKSVNFLKATTSFFDFCTTAGIYINANGGNAANHNYIDCWAGDTTAGNGMLIQNSGAGIVSGFNLTNHQASHNSGNGIATTGVITDVTIIGGSFSDNLGAGGLNLGHAGAVKVIGADIGGLDGGSPNAQYGIVFGASITYLFCAYNHILGNTVDAILDNVPNTVIKFVNNNVIPTYSKVGSIVVGASPFSYTAPYDMSVYIFGGTVSSIKVNTLAVLAASPATVALRYGETLEVTYSGLPGLTYSA